MRAAHGPDWWLKVPGPVQRTAAQNKSDEKKDSWHGKRGERELDYESDVARRHRQ